MTTKEGTMRRRCGELKLRTGVRSAKVFIVFEASFMIRGGPGVSVVVYGGSRGSALGGYVSSVLGGSACGGCRVVVIRGGDARNRAFRCCGRVRGGASGMEMICFSKRFGCSGIGGFNIRCTANRCVLFLGGSARMVARG